MDLNSKKVINNVKNAHYNSVLSCEFDPFKSFILATAGMDYSVKYWDIRKFKSPISVVNNETHWIWDVKYNRKFSRVKLTASSSSVVRGIVHEKVNDIEEEEKIDYPHNFKYFTVDYVEFDDSVYSLDWSYTDPWIFGAVSYNSYLYINSITEDIKYQIMLDN